MRTLLILSLLLFIPFQPFCQFLHMPSDIELILEESGLAYVFDSMEGKITLQKHLANSIMPVVKIPDSIQIAMAPGYETSEDYEKYRIKAQKFEEKKKYDKAVETYLTALKLVKVNDRWAEAQTIQNIANCHISQH